MSEASKKSKEPTLPGFDEPTSSPGSAGGTLPSDSPDGERTEKSGPPPAPANRSRPQGKVAAPTTPATSGPTPSGSSLSAALGRSLESRSLRRLGSDGSMEYSQTWKEKATPAGRRLWAHTASARRTSVKDSTGSPIEGWPKTPQASDGDGGVMEIRPGTTGKYKLRDYAHLAGWATTRAKDGTNPAGMSTDRQKAGKAPDSLHQQTKLVGWPTARTVTGGPESSTRKQELGRTESGGGDLQAVALTALGPITGLFLVPTGRRAVLAPEFSLWLMGFPEAWVGAAPGAKDWLEAQAVLESECSRGQGTPSSQTLPPSSSEPF